MKEERFKYIGAGVAIVGAVLSLYVFLLGPRLVLNTEIEQNAVVDIHPHPQ